MRSEHADLTTAGGPDRRPEERIADPVIRVVPHAVDQHGTFEAGFGARHEVGEYRFAPLTRPRLAVGFVERLRRQQLGDRHAPPDEPLSLAEEASNIPS